MILTVALPLPCQRPIYEITLHGYQIDAFLTTILDMCEMCLIKTGLCAHVQYLLSH